MSEVAAPAPRKRGRPRKAGNPKPKPVVLDENGQPRKRGRPRKYPLGESPKPKAPTGRGRGRPKKSDTATGTTTTTTTTAAKSAAKKLNGSAAASAVGATNMAGKPKGANFHMDNIRSTYSLQCEEVEENWPEMAGNMKMKVVEQVHGFCASFDLGIITGIMLFAPDKKSLDNFAAIKSEGENIGSEDDDADEDAEGEDDSDEQAQQPPAKKARRNTSYTATPPVLKSRRVIFKWRGQEESTGQIHTSSLDGNEGYLEFEDDDATNFVGYAGFPAMGSNCKFTGTRIGGSRGPITSLWSDFSQKAADEANANRWK